MTCELIKRDLDAYFDRELDAQASAAVRAHVATCAACRRQLVELETLAGLVRGAPYYKAPDRLRARVMALSIRPTRLWQALRWAAAAVLVLSAGAAMTLWRPAPGRTATFADDVVNSHMRSLMVDHLFDVKSTDMHTVKPWFIGKLDFSPPVADLASKGFPLVGGRLDYVGGRPVAALVYQRRSHVINVFVAPEGDDQWRHDSVLAVRGFNLRHWVQNGMSCWAVSDLNGAELTEFANALQNPGPVRRDSTP